MGSVEYMLLDNRVTQCNVIRAKYFRYQCLAAVGAQSPSEPAPLATSGPEKAQESGQEVRVLCRKAPSLPPVISPLSPV